MKKKKKDKMNQMEKCKFTKSNLKRWARVKVERRNTGVPYDKVNDRDDVLYETSERSGRPI